MARSRSHEELIEVGARLRAARIALGLSQKDLYDAIGVKASAWNHWESGKRLPDPMAMVQLYRMHGITMEWIYGGDLRSRPHGVSLGVLEATP